VGELFQLGEAKKPAGAFDGVNGAEYAGQNVAGLRVLFQNHQLGIEAVEVLGALNQKFLNDVTVAHRGFLPSRDMVAGTRRAGRGGIPVPEPDSSPSFLSIVCL
jgi:hypothetical protein